ncbi:methyltransferase family protein [Stakelama tenebrarum]|uniref:Isoprenylcysteine carboxylmethyltransferase family protein n=1 Tax=Stakelama tenebrarum TaxID=2711215 RepID=A0A6G6Y8U1_9SPHN|nr:isoprenylcysteine carboxylmethyltransferase family protein [Sphingosinithalassobacter tenebrarum]QIG81345.1 isoprenylcysteine carboxylmethyltransferase family protein [Sphingosinithalassobacter tenebrarum]
MTPVDHLAYAAAWLAFGMLHSMSAGATARRGLGRLLGRWHRIGYNLLATGQLAAVLAVGALVSADAPGWSRPPLLIAAQAAMLALGAVLGVIALRSYRAGPFLGSAQLRGEDDDGQPLAIDGLHRRMRHPLYTAAMLILWGLVRSDVSFATALWASLYFHVGSRFEERRLIARYGDVYRRYRREVPRFLPRLFGTG